MKVPEDMNRGGLVDLKTCIVSIEMPKRTGRGGQGGGDSLHHVGTEAVGDNAKPLCFESGAQEVVGSRFSVGAAGHDDPAANLRGKRGNDMRIDFQGRPARKRRTGTALQVAGCEGSLGCGNCQKSAQMQSVPPCEWSGSENVTTGI